MSKPLKESVEGLRACALRSANLNRLQDGAPTASGGPAIQRGLAAFTSGASARQKPCGFRERDYRFDGRVNHIRLR